MIPDFKTFIKESVWGDIRKRGLGDESKEEDLISDIYEYLNACYTVTDKEKIEYKNDSILIPVFYYKPIRSYATIYIDSTGEVSFSSVAPNNYKKNDHYTKNYVNLVKDDCNDLYEKIKEKYSPEIDEFNGLECWYTFHITPECGKISKEFCSELIDFIINNMSDNNKNISKVLERKITESVWSDIRKQGLGGEVKKEDDINNLDIDGLYEYLKDTYKLSRFGESFSRNVVKINDETISIPILMEYVPKNMPQTLYFSIKSKNDEKYISISPSLRNWAPDVYNLLKHHFTFDEVVKKQNEIVGVHYIKIKPKDGSEVTNKFYIDLIDFTLENVNDYKLCKLIERK